MVARHWRELAEGREADGFLSSLGLDPVWERLPEKLRRDCPSIQETLFQFNKAVIEATGDLVKAFKFQAACYYRFILNGGPQALKRSIDLAKVAFPRVLVLLDCKATDIGSTAVHYRDMAIASPFSLEGGRYLIDNFGADGLTSLPYFGWEAIKVYFDDPAKLIVVMGKTSNPGSGEFQDGGVFLIGTERVPKFLPLYRLVARRLASKETWNRNGNVGIVAGGTYPELMAEIREEIGEDMEELIPGVGTQGATEESAVRFGTNSSARRVIINNSSGLIFASAPSKDAPAQDNFAEASRAALLSMNERIAQARAVKLNPCLRND